MKTKGIPVICVLSIVAVALAANAPKPATGDGAGFRKVKDLQGERKAGWPITDVVFSAAGKTLAAANHFKVRLWQVDSGKELAAFFGKNDEQIMAVRFLGGGKHLVSASNRTVRVWDWAKGVELRNLPGCHTVELSRDGKRLLAATEGGCGLWRTDNWKLVRPFKLPPHRTLALSPDGRMIAVGERMLPKPYPPNYGAAVIVLSAETGRELARFTGFAVQVVFSPEGKRLAVVQNGVALWSLAGKKLLRTFKAGRLGCGSAAFSPNGRLIAAGGGYDPAMKTSRGALAVWDVASGRLLAKLGVREGKKGREWVTNVAFSADGKYLAACDSQGAVRIWQVPLATLKAHTKLFTKLYTDVESLRFQQKLAELRKDALALTSKSELLKSLGISSARLKVAGGNVGAAHEWTDWQISPHYYLVIKTRIVNQIPNWKPGDPVNLESAVIVKRQ